MHFIVVGVELVCRRTKYQKCLWTSENIEYVF